MFRAKSSSRCGSPSNLLVSAPGGLSRPAFDSLLWYIRLSNQFSMCSRGNIAGIPPRRKSHTLHFRPNFAGLMPDCRKNAWARVIAFIFVALWSIAPRFASCQTSEEQVELSFRTGQEAMKHGQFVRDAEEFKKVLALDPSLIEAEVNLGLAYHSLSEYDLAVRHLTKALRERPNLRQMSHR